MVWPCHNKYWDKLKACSQKNLFQIGKTYRRLVNRKGEFKINDETMCHLKELGQVLKHLWLKRDTELFTFFDHPLTKVPSNTYTIIECQLSPHLLEVVNKNGQKITTQVLEDHKKKISA